MKSVRKIYSLIICLALILASLSISSGRAAAAEDGSSLECINILDYSMPNGGSSIQVMTSSTDVIRFYLPFNYASYFWDLVVVTPVPLTSAEIVGNSASVSLTVSLLESNSGSYTYRCYGSSPLYPYGTSNIGVRFGSSSNKFTVNFSRFDAYTVVNQGIGDLGEMNVTPNADTSVSPNYWYRQSSPGVPIVQDFVVFSSAVQFYDFQVLYSSVNWRKYDYLDFAFSINAASINSISAYIETSSSVYRYLPFDISFLDGSSIDKNEYVGSGTTTVIPASTSWDIVMRVYIPSSYRLSGSLYIQVDGEYNLPASRAWLQSVNGYYYSSIPDPSLVKLDQIESAIREALSSSAEDNAAAEEFSENMTSQKEQMAANQQTLNNVSKPTSTDLGTMAAPDAVLDTGGMNMLVSIISPITNSKIVLGIMTLSATLALVSYVFFGKKR